MPQLLAAATLLSLIFPVVAATAQEPPVNPDAQVLLDFKERVDQYVALRKKADDHAPPLKETADPDEIRSAQQALAEHIRSLRPMAKRGDIFTAEASVYFRRLLRPELKDKGTKELVADDNPGNIPFKVNGSYPEKEPLSTVPPKVLEALPKLPENLEYRFIGKHLVLRDVRASLIVDYIANAIP